MLSGEATNVNFIVCCHTRQKLEPTFYRTRSEQSTHYTNNVVGKQNMMAEKLPLAVYNFHFSFNIGGDIGIHEEIHLTWLFFIANTIYV